MCRRMKAAAVAAAAATLLYWDSVAEWGPGECWLSRRQSGTDCRSVEYIILYVGNRSVCFHQHGRQTQTGHAPGLKVKWLVQRPTRRHNQQTIHTCYQRGDSKLWPEDQIQPAGCSFGPWTIDIEFSRLLYSSVKLRFLCFTRLQLATGWRTPLHTLTCVHILVHLLTSHFSLHWMIL